MTGGKTSTNIKTARLRTLFLRTLARVAPQTMLSLRDEVLPVYESEVANGRTPLRRRRGYPLDAARWTGTPELEAAVERWATDWGLGAPWVKSHALRQVEMWAALPDEVRGTSLRWLTSETRTMRLPEPRKVAPFMMTPPLPPWWPVSQTWTAYRDMLRMVIDERLHEYRLEVEADYEKWEEQEVYPAARRHMEWLVHYVVLRQKYDDIAELATREYATGSCAPVDRGGVKAGVKKAADLIALPRGHRRGRPRGRKTTNSTYNRVTGTSRQR